MTLPYIVDFVCFAAALAGIGGYVLAFLRNRPYVRPLNSLGLLLTGAALLAAPTVANYATHGGAQQGPTIYMMGLLCLSVVFQLIAALRRRKPRSGEANPGERAGDAAGDRRARG